MQVNRLPNPIIEHTYRECIQTYLGHFKKNVDLKIAKAKHEYDLKVEKLEQDRVFKEKKLESRQSRPSRGDEDSSPLMAAKLRQDIRLGIAKEEQLLTKLCIDRQDYVAKEALAEMVEPLLMSIRQELLELGNIDDELARKVDAIMGNLQDLGVKLLADSVYDADKAVKRILAKEVIPEEVNIEDEMERLF
jgi:hypothetical protein